MSARPFETHNHAANGGTATAGFQVETHIQATNFSE
jgi:hypothetical protein